MPAPTINVAPTITGTFQVGQVVTCGTGSWNNTPTSYAYQWRHNGVAIPGATSSTHTLRQAEMGPGPSIDCLVTASNASGPGTAAASNVIVVATVAGLSWDVFAAQRLSSGIWH